MITVQHTRQVWTKDERTAKFADNRNKLALGAQVPLESSGHPMIVHRRGFHRLGKQPGPYQEIDFAEGVNSADQYWSFDFKVKDNVLTARFKYDYHKHGLPRRRGFSRRMPVFKIGFGESVQLLINGRHVYRSYTEYSRNIVNFAFGEYDRLVFLDKEFIRVINLEGSLF